MDEIRKCDVAINLDKIGYENVKRVIPRKSTKTTIYFAQHDKKCITDLDLSRIEQTDELYIHMIGIYDCNIIFNKSAKIKEFVIYYNSREESYVGIKGLKEVDSIGYPQCLADSMFNRAFGLKSKKFRFT